MKALLLPLAAFALACPAVANDQDVVARNLTYCVVIADVLSRDSAQIREYRDLFFRSARALTSREFVVAESGPALKRVEARILEAKHRGDAGGSSQQQLNLFIEELKHCLVQVRENGE